MQNAPFGYIGLRCADDLLLVQFLFNRSQSDHGAFLPQQRNPAAIEHVLYILLINKMRPVGIQDSDVDGIDQLAGLLFTHKS